MRAKGSLVPRPLPDFISQPWRKVDFSPQLRDKIWEWPGDEAMQRVHVCISAPAKVSYIFNKIQDVFKDQKHQIQL